MRECFALSGIVRCLLGVVACLAVVSAYGQSPIENVKIDAEVVDFDEATMVTSARENVVIRYEDYELRADAVEMNVETKDVRATGNVLLLHDPSDFEWQGQAIEGNFDDRLFEFGKSRGRLDKWYYRADKAVYRPDKVLVIDGASLSTCEEDSYYRTLYYTVNSRQAEVYPDGWVKAWDNYYKLWDVPVFYWPYAAMNTREKSGWHIRAGYSGEYRSFLFVEKEMTLANGWTHVPIFHFREKNGIGLGYEMYKTTENARTRLLMYYIDDNDAPQSFSTPGFNRRFVRQNDRFRVRFEHWQRVTDRLTLDIELDRLSDIDMLEDFFATDYRDMYQPDNHVALDYDGEWFQAGAQVRSRLNSFYTVVERAPEFRFEVPRRPFLKEWLAYQSNTSTGHYRMRWREFDQPRAVAPDPADYDTVRFDTAHVFYTPLTLGPVNFVPRAGVRFTHYADSSVAPAGANLNALFEADDPEEPFNTVAVINYDDDGGALNRLAGEVGMEVNTRMHWTSGSSRNETLEVNGLRYVLEPYANYTLAPDPTEDRNHIYFFDEIDRLIRQNFVRVGTRHRWQTRKGRKIYTLASLDGHVDYHFSEEEGRENLGNLGVDGMFSPTNQFRFNSSVVYDMGENDLNAVGASVTTGNPKIVKATLAYTYRNDYDARTVYSMGSYFNNPLAQNWLDRQYDESHSTTLSLAIPWGEKTRFNARATYDLEEEEFATKSLNVVRDLDCWIGSVGLNQNSEHDVTVMLTLYLKAYPQFGLTSTTEFEND